MTACDGFVIPPTTYGDVGRMMVPELQRREAFLREYVGEFVEPKLRPATGEDQDGRD